MTKTEAGFLFFALYAVGLLQTMAYRLRVGGGEIIALSITSTIVTLVAYFS
jgi:hypothetical protein